MRILSPFRDYYDRIAHQYGGGDPKVTWVRPVDLPVSEVEMPHGCPFVDDFQFATLDRPRGRYSVSTKEYRILCVAGRGWLMIRDEAGFPNGENDFGCELYLPSCQIIDPPEEAWGWRTERHGKRTRRIRESRWQVFRQDGVPFVQGEQHPWIIEVSRRASNSRNRFRPQPVFVIREIRDRGDKYVQFERRTPVLAELGLPSLLSAEQIYQEIAYFVGNVLLPSPDTRPPVEVDNKHKIIAAGFDLRESFRHRK